MARTKPVSFTPEQIEIIKKCKGEGGIEYFIENFCFIQAPSLGVFKFSLFPFQKEVLYELLGTNFVEDFKNGVLDIDKFNNIVKSRGMGISTLMGALALYLITFITGFNVAIIATDLDTAQGIYKKIDLMYENLPDFLKQKWKKRTQKELILKNQSGVKCYAHNKRKGVRSLHASFIIIDEAHFIEGMEKAWETIEPAVDHGIKCVALSSPDYTEGWFYDIYLNSLKDDDDEDKIWKLVELPWYLHPHRQMKDGSPDWKWRRSKDVQHGKRKASKEYDAKFSFSSDVYFEPEDLEYIENSMVIEPKWKSRKLWVWKRPVKGRRYVVTVDGAEGGGKSDNNHVHVIDIDDFEQVAEYVSKEDYIKFGMIPIELAKSYNNALLIIERNSVGLALIQRAQDEEYENLYIKGIGKDKDVLDDKVQKFGIRTTPKSRPLFIGALRSFVETEKPEDKLIIRSARTMNELKTFIDKGGKPQAKSGRTDDGILSLSFFAYVYSTENFSVDPQTKADDFYNLIRDINKSQKNNNDIIKNRNPYQNPEIQRYKKVEKKLEKKLGTEKFEARKRLTNLMGIDRRTALNYSDWLN